MSADDHTDPDNNKQRSDGQDSTSDSDDLSASEVKSESEGRPAPPSSSNRARGGGFGLWLVAVVALVALGLAIYPWLDSEPEGEDFASKASVEAVEQHLERALEELSDRLERTEQTLEAAAVEREGLIDQLDQAASSRSELSSLVERQARSLDELETELGAQLQELWQQEGQQREVDRELERRLRLLEAASLLRFGQERAELGGDWSAARGAYERAERLVRAVDDPRLGQVRRLLAAEMDSLEAAREPDWARWQVRLTRMADSTSAWPLRTTSEAADPAPDLEADGSGWLADMRSALGRLFTVSRRDELALPDEVLDSLREQLRLRLVAAELALVRRNLVELGHQLGAALDLMEQWFDDSDADVSEASERLRELQSLQAPQAPDGLGQALRALQSQLDSA